MGVTSTQMMEIDTYQYKQEQEEQADKKVIVLRASQIIQKFHKRLLPFLYNDTGYLAEIDTIRKELANDMGSLRLLDIYISKRLSQIKEDRRNKNENKGKLSELDDVSERMDTEWLQASLKSEETHEAIFSRIKNGQLTIDGSDTNLYNFFDELLIILSIKGLVTTLELGNLCPIVGEDKVYENNMDALLYALFVNKELKSLIIYNCVILNRNQASLVKAIKVNSELIQLDFENVEYRNWINLDKQELSSTIYSLSKLSKMQFDLELYNEAEAQKFKTYMLDTQNLVSIKLPAVSTMKTTTTDFHRQWVIFITGLQVNTTLTSLDLSHCFSKNTLQGEDNEKNMLLLATFLSHTKTLTELNLGYNHLDKNCLSVLATAFMLTSHPRNTSLVSLILHSIRYESNSLEFLFISLRDHPALKELYFGDNVLSTKDIRYFADLMNAPTSQLTDLRLDMSEFFHPLSESNPYEAKNDLINAINTLAKALSTNQSLTHFDLSDNDLGEPVLKVFQEVIIINKSLTWLQLYGNYKVTTETVKAITSALASNKYLNLLSLPHSIDFVPLYETALQQNKTLISFAFNFDSICEDPIFNNCKQLLKRNKQLQITHKLNVSRIAILIAFARANEKSNIRYSVLPLIPTIISSIGDRNNDYDFQYT